MWRYCSTSAVPVDCISDVYLGLISNHFVSISIAVDSVATKNIDPTFMKYHYMLLHMLQNFTTKATGY